MKKVGEKLLDGLVGGNWGKESFEIHLLDGRAQKELLWWLFLVDCGSLLGF